MRAGYTIVNFIHDEVICEVPEDENLPAKIADIELMIAGMHEVVPGANVRVETSVRRSFSKADTVTLPAPEKSGAEERVVAEQVVAVNPAASPELQAPR